MGAWAPEFELVQADRAITIDEPADVGEGRPGKGGCVAADQFDELVRSVGPVQRAPKAEVVC